MAKVLTLLQNPNGAGTWDWSTIVESHVWEALSDVDRCIERLLEAGGEVPPPDADWELRTYVNGVVRRWSFDLRNRLAPLRALLAGADQEVDRLERMRAALAGPAPGHTWAEGRTVKSERKDVEKSLMKMRELRFGVANTIAEADRVLATTERVFGL